MRSDRFTSADLDALAGRRVLVTGAGGSIGSALCRVIARVGAVRLTMLDRDDSALHALQFALEGSSDLTELQYHLADVCEEGVLRSLLTHGRPEVVLHAAALKHVPLLESNPAEAYRVNVLGTRSVLRAAVECQAEVFVNVSTDKASNPTTVLGRTKRLGERLTGYIGDTTGRRFMSVRMGNVLGSRGSFLWTFLDQLENGQPLTVTHEDVTRFLMTLDDVVDFIAHAVARGGSGETLIADMGEPVRILDVAKALVGDSGQGPPIRITGLRPGDKLHEDFLDDSEVATRAANSGGITRVRVSPINPDSLDRDCFLRSVEQAQSDHADVSCQG